MRLRTQGEAERRSLAGRGLDPDPPAILFHDPFANRQTQPITGILAAMQAFEDHKDLIVKAGIDAEAIVAHRKYRLARLFNGGHMNLRRLFPSKRKGIDQQVPEYMAKLRGIARYFR